MYAYHNRDDLLSACAAPDSITAPTHKALRQLYHMFADTVVLGNIQMTYHSSTMNVVREYILSEFLSGEEPINLTPDTPLVSTGILDSLATLKLVSFLEGEFDIHVKPHEADEEHLNTLKSICELVDSKR